MRDRLGEIASEIQLPTAHRRIVVHRRGQQNNRRVFESRIAAHKFSDGETAHFRHLVIEQRQTERLSQFLRLNQGKSPFLGSKDHFALRLEMMGFSRGRVVLMAAAAAGFMGFCAFLVTQLPLKSAVAVYVLVAILVSVCWRQWNNARAACASKNCLC